ncbi:MAG TPA: peptide deformylase [Planctomycetota bacterium]|nr:peptide deformylase [Planctomycetota bacterium]
MNEKSQEKLEFSLSLYPDPVLRKVAQPVGLFDDRLQSTVAAMFERMRASHGVGLAAPQVGLTQRILVLNPTGEPKDDLALINVSIVERSGPLTSFEEGCLSFPDIYAEVKRPERCKVFFWTPEGERIEREFEGFTSRIVQHEYDHLEGVLLVDRMSPADKARHKPALAALIERYKSRALSGSRK